MRISPYSKIILDEAEKFGIKYFPIGENGRMFLLRRKGKFTYLYQSLTELVSNPAYIIAANKFLTSRALKKAGFPVPKCKLIRSYDEAVDFLRQHKKIVLKPLSANRGRGITIGIKTRKELREAMDLAMANTRLNLLRPEYAGRVLAEKAVPGDDHRILVIDYKYVFAIKKIPAYVIGDGRRDIGQLIALKNREKKTHKKKIIVDDSLEHVLSRQGLTLHSVPAAGRQVFVRRTANLATGGESIDITDKLNSKVKAMAIRAARALNMRVAGFDFMCRDYTKDKGYFIEVNPIPGLMIHHFPHQGRGRNPAGKIIETLIKHKLI